MNKNINKNCPCPATRCSVKGNCRLCFSKHRNSRTSCIKQAIENKKINFYCPKEKSDLTFGKCEECREIALEKSSLTFCQELGHQIYNSINKE